MTAKEINNKIEEKFPGKVSKHEPELGDPWIEVDPASIQEIMSFLKSETELEFDELMCLSGVDYGAENELGVTYHLCSTTRGSKVTVKVKLPRDNPALPTVSNLWKTANWHEREAYDLFGIVFEGHPDLTRILLPDDWEGYPLRKDYVLNKTYRDIRFKD
jgi:NADH-quinone oxidoreductase subunit C